MKERPLLFSAPMVQALLVGTKTQTRRVMRFQPGDDTTVHVEHFNQTVIDRHGDEQPGPEVFGAWWNDGESGLRCPYGAPGDRLWVRETWAPNEGAAGGYLYRADHAGASALERHDLKTGACTHRVSKWRPSIHIPRAASRILLEVTDVRVERLQDISEADAIAEGIETMREHDKDARPTGRTLGLERWPGDEPHWGRPQDAYAALWESINGAGSWDANPFVWAVSFRILKGPQP